MVTEKKKFFVVKIPLISKEVELFGNSQSSFEGRTIKLDLTPELRGKGAELKLLISLKGDELEANPIELTLMGAYIRRMMRKGTDYVEDSFEAESKDHILRIKPFLITRKKVSKKVRTGLREVARKEILDYTKSRTMENIILDVINNKLQKELIVKLKKIYPLALCEIRSVSKAQKLKEKKQEPKENKED